MISRTIEKDGVLVTVTRETRWSLLQNVFYRTALLRLYPTLAKVLDNDLPEAEFRAMLEALPQGERDFYSFAITFLNCAPQISRANGFPFLWPKIGEMPTDAQVREIFEFYMTDADGLWSDIIQAVTDLAAPLTPPEQRPLDMLTEAEQKDENLSSRDDGSNGTTKRRSKSLSVAANGS